MYRNYLVGLTPNRSSRTLLSKIVNSPTEMGFAKVDRGRQKPFGRNILDFTSGSAHTEEASCGSGGEEKRQHKGSKGFSFLHGPTFHPPVDNGSWQRVTRGVPPTTFVRHPAGLGWSLCVPIKTQLFSWLLRPKNQIVFSWLLRFFLSLNFLGQVVDCGPRLLNKHLTRGRR